MKILAQIESDTTPQQYQIRVGEDFEPTVLVQLGDFLKPILRLVNIWFGLCVAILILWEMCLWIVN